MTAFPKRLANGCADRGSSYLLPAIFVVVSLLAVVVDVASSADLPASAAVINLSSEEEAGGIAGRWEVISGNGTLCEDTNDRAEGRASIRLEVEKGHELQVASTPIALSRGCIYRLELFAKRTPGNHLSFFLQENLPDSERQTSLQLHLPGRFRPNWFPVAPFWERYHAYFSTRSDGVGWRLMVKQKNEDARIGQCCWVDGITLAPVAKVQETSSQKESANLLPPKVVSFAPDSRGFPAAWGIWWGEAEKIHSVTSADGAPVLRVEWGNYGLTPGYIPVEFCHVYRFSIWAKGIGSVSIGIHPLADHPDYWCRADTALRVGDPHTVQFQLTDGDWQMLSGRWVAEIPGMRWFNPFIALSGEFEFKYPELKEE